MSAAAEFVKDAGPIAIGIGGLAVAYANSRQPGREARHHARVETLYQDMLDLLEFRIQNGMRAHSIGEIDPLPNPVPEAYKVTSARLRLYATPAVRDAWGQAYTLSGAYESAPEIAGKPSVVAMQELFAIERAVNDLVDRMRADLGVPRESAVRRVRGFKARLMNGMRLKRELRRLQRGRTASEETSKDAGA